jgi:hypothetical protein
VIRARRFLSQGHRRIGAAWGIVSINYRLPCGQIDRANGFCVFISPMRKPRDSKGSENLSAMVKILHHFFSFFQFSMIRKGGSGDSTFFYECLFYSQFLRTLHSIRSLDGFV